MPLHDRSRRRALQRLSPAAVTLPSRSPRDASPPLRRASALSLWVELNKKEGRRTSKAAAAHRSCCLHATATEVAIAHTTRCFSAAPTS